MKERILSYLGEVLLGGGISLFGSCLITDSFAWAKPIKEARKHYIWTKGSLQGMQCYSVSPKKKLDMDKREIKCNFWGNENLEMAQGERICGSHGL